MSSTLTYEVDTLEIIAILYVSAYLHFCEKEPRCIVTTKDKVIEAAVELVNEKGYKGATTKAIADRAGVNEVTIFRHFGNKRGIVQAAVEKYAFAEPLFDYFRRHIVWDIERDLKMLTKQYQALLTDKQFLILLSLKEANQFPELNDMLSRIPQKYKFILEDYFQDMIKRNKIKEIDVPTAVDSFIFLNFGFFMMKRRMLKEGEMSVTMFVDNHIDLFIQSLR